MNYLYQKAFCLLIIFTLSACVKNDNNDPDNNLIKESPLFNETPPAESNDISRTEYPDIADLLATDTVGQKIVSVAMHELGRGPEEVGMDQTEYPFNISNYMPLGDAWCSEFVSWVYCAAGWPLTEGTYGGWMQNSHSKLMNWFSSHPELARWHDKGINDWNTFVPKPGDYIRFIWSSSGNGHSGIIREVDGNTLYTVEGNYSNSVKLRTISAWRSWSEINGIGTRNLVDLPDIEDMTIKLVSSLNGLVLASRQNSNYIYTELDNGGDNQHWKVTVDNHGFFLFENVETGLFLNTDPDCSYLMAYDNNSEYDKCWMVVDDGLGNTIISNFAMQGYCIDVNSDDNGDYARVFRNNFRADKFWKIEIIQ